MKISKILAGVAICSLAMWTVSAASELESAKKLADQGVIKAGSVASDFGLTNTITRKEMMKIVMNLSGKNVPDQCSGSFGDVANDWGCKYIESALSNGFIASNAQFRPNDTISKAESMKLVLKAKGIDKAYNTADWQADYMQTALDNGIIPSSYANHTASAFRGWIFGISAAEKWSNTGSSSQAAPIQEVAPVVAPAPTVKETPVKTAEKTGYIDYDDSLVGLSDKTVLFFHAAWCPTCIAADKNIKSTLSEVDNFLLLKTDYDSNIELRKKYGVTTQHTFVRINKEWKLIKKWSGSNSVKSIKDKIGVN